MFFRSPSSFLAAIALSVVGLFLFASGWTYADAAKRERTTAGTITHVDCGRSSCAYQYVFKVNGVAISDQTSTCRTALTPLGCRKDASVKVYYDPQDLSSNLLEEFGYAGRGRLFLGTWMVGCGLLLIGLYFLLNKLRPKSGSSENPDGPISADASDSIHVVPSE
jgi:hypothetical protein